MMYNTYLVIRKHPRLIQQASLDMSLGRSKAVGVFGEYKARLRVIGCFGDVDA
jgi:hypothetical protein